jgi:hypothetical protein
MKGQGFIVLGAFLLACVIGVGIPYYMTVDVRKGIPDPRLEIPNTGGSPTPTISTERALTQAEYARLVFSPTSSSTSPPATFTLSPIPSPLYTFTAVVPLTGAQSLTPTATVTRTRRPIFFTSTSQSDPFVPPTFTRTANPYSNPDIDPDPYPNADAEPHSHKYTSADRHAHIHAIANQYTYSNQHAIANKYTYSNQHVTTTDKYISASYAGASHACASH